MINFNKLHRNLQKEYVFQSWKKSRFVFCFTICDSFECNLEYPHKTPLDLYIIVATIELKKSKSHAA